jgi:hypothetical protein
VESLQVSTRRCSETYQSFKVKKQLETNIASALIRVPLTHSHITPAVFSPNTRSVLPGCINDNTTKRNQHRTPQGRSNGPEWSRMVQNGPEIPSQLRSRFRIYQPPQRSPNNALPRACWPPTTENHIGVTSAILSPHRTWSKKKGVFEVRQKSHVLTIQKKIHQETRQHKYYSFDRKEQVNCTTNIVLHVQKLGLSSFNHKNIKQKIMTINLKRRRKQFYDNQP